MKILELNIKCQPKTYHAIPSTVTQPRHYQTIQQLPITFRKQFFRLIYSILILTSGCNRATDYQDLEQFIKQTKQIQPQTIPDLPNLQVAATADLNLKSLTNPFTPRISAANSLKPVTQHLPEPLETYSLDSLKMVGTLSENHKIWGIVMAPDNTTHSVKLGDYIGQNSGKIIAIYPNTIKILELMPQGTIYLAHESALTLK